MRYRLCDPDQDTANNPNTQISWMSKVFLWISMLVDTLLKIRSSLQVSVFVSGRLSCITNVGPKIVTEICWFIESIVHQINWEGYKVLTTTDLKNLVIQQASTKNGDALVVHHWFVTSGKGSCHFLLAVKEKSHVFLLHRDGNAVPPAGFMGIDRMSVTDYGLHEGNVSMKRNAVKLRWK